jgi:PKD repeat protein
VDFKLRMYWMSVKVTVDQAADGSYSVGMESGDLSLSIRNADVQLNLQPPVLVAPPPVAIDPPVLPAATLQAAFTVAVDGATVHIADLTTGAVREQWTLGDGGTSNVMGDQSKTYRYAKTYTITLIAWDASGKTSKTSATVTTTQDAAPAAPLSGAPSDPSPSLAKPSFSATVDGAAVHITDTTTGAVKEQWSWGNGGTSNAMGDQDITYRTAKTYTITLTAWDAAGKSAKVSQDVTTLEDAPVAAPPAG